MSAFVLSLCDPNATLETVGGKGMSLAKLVRAGLPVPDGFHVTTYAYRCFVEENGLQARIDHTLSGADMADPARLEIISQQIIRDFSNGIISPEIAGAVTAAYTTLAGNTPPGGEAVPGPGVPVAVRSSATAEDLPGASFAGLQETYLNIRGADAVQAAVKQCWASLWTARAIAYRARQGIAPETVALAVVVQELVIADASGVMFTADPVSGKRDVMVITAAWGLGEAVVGGLVTPDSLKVDKPTGRLIRRETSQKQVMTVLTDSGTHEQAVPKAIQSKPVLNPSQAAELAKLGAEIENLYQMPMDIEWTLSAGKFAIVQARPVTSLPEPPLEWLRSNPKSVLSRSSFAEFVPDPVSPLFATLAVPIAQIETQKMTVALFGMKDPIDYLFDVINGYVYIGFAGFWDPLWKMSVLSLTQFKKVLRKSTERWMAVRARNLSVVRKWQVDLTGLTAPELLDGVREIFSATGEYYTVAQSGPIPSAQTSEMIFSRFYQALVKRKQDPTALTFLLGLETLPLRAEKSLYDLSMWVRAQPELADYWVNSPTEALCAALKLVPMPVPFSEEFSTRFHAHLAEFGHAIYDLDFAKAVPADDPTPIVEAVRAHLLGKAVNPYQRQQDQAKRRGQAEMNTLQRLDPLRRKWFKQLLKWAQDCSPVREDCIADLGLGYPQMRRMLDELGQRLTARGAISRREDVYWLESQEADALANALQSGEDLPSYSDAVQQRKAFWQRARSITPPSLLPDMPFITKFLVHDNPRGNTLKGYGASPGQVTARACVLRGPDEFSRMCPGDVIVAVTTTPAWTPLFAMASAVVTDIGGPLSHCSIVAREYGIPAVMATGKATRRIQHGQMITVDGSAGMVNLLD